MQDDHVKLNPRLPRQKHLDFRLSPRNKYWFSVLGFCTVRRMFADDVSGAAVGPIFNGHRLDHWRWYPQRLPKRRRQTYPTHRAKTQNRESGRTLRQLYGHKFKGKTSKILHLEHSFSLRWKLDTSESRSEIPGKFWNVVLEKNSIRSIWPIFWELIKY